MWQIQEQILEKSENTPNDKKMKCTCLEYRFCEVHVRNGKTAKVMFGALNIQFSHFYGLYHEDK